MGEKKLCQDCDQDAQKYKASKGKFQVTYRATACPKFKSANLNAKIGFLNQIKKKIGFICKFCSGYNHKSEDCFKKHSNCNQCQEPHLTNLHELQTALNCYVTSIVVSARMSLQDIQITKGTKKPLSACVLLDNGGQIALACLQVLSVSWVQVEES